jgi:transcriptional regulator with XRE-family HTH domain
MLKSHRPVLADNIRHHRRRLGMSQSQLATAVGVSLSAVAHWERPLGNAPSLPRLIKLAGLFCIGMDTLFIPVVPGPGQPATNTPQSAACSMEGNNPSQLDDFS